MREENGNKDIHLVALTYVTIQCDHEGKEYLNGNKYGSLLLKAAPYTGGILNDGSRKTKAGELCQRYVEADAFSGTGRICRSVAVLGWNY